MSYDFSFSKKAISFVLAGFTFVGLMLFAAGLLIGTNWKAEPVAVAANAVDKQLVDVPPPTPAPDVAAQEPVLSANVARPGAAMPLGADAGSSLASPPVRQAHGNALIVDDRRWQARAPVAAPAAATTTTTAPHDNELRVIQEAEPASANEDAGTAPFSVQVGVFVAEKDAHQLVRQLQKKGYTPVVLAANDDESRLWYSVRIGAYKNMTDAAHAASNISEQEKLKAAVRPLGSL
jgi:cell division septation protein DedD